jgi:hypothetical protein
VIATPSKFPGFAGTPARLLGGFCVSRGLLLQTNCGNVAERISRHASGQPDDLFDSCRESLTDATEFRLLALYLRRVASWTHVRVRVRLKTENLEGLVGGFELLLLGRPLPFIGGQIDKYGYGSNPPRL